VHIAISFGVGALFILVLVEIGLRILLNTGLNERENERPELLGTRKEEKLPSGNYSTVKSTQRVSATLSIRPSGRVQIIDM
jgi:hypothetical protein